MLSGESVATVLYALATGFPDRAINVVAMSTKIDEPERAVLWTALTLSDDRSEQARRFGDALRSLGAPPASVNDAYRSAFYSGDAWKSLSDNPLFAYFSANRGGSPLDKWVHYFPIYERHLAAYRDSPARVLEIGVYRGGGLEMLRHYLGPTARIVGIDIDPSSRSAAGREVVEIGDQEDPVFLTSVVERHGPFDIVIDDGGHTMRQQIRSIETLFPLLADGGVYLVEDCHTSYWTPYLDPDDPAATFVGWVKDRLDDLHAYHHSTELDLTAPWQTDLAAVHAYDSVIVLDRARRHAPFSEVAGTSDYINTGRESSIINIELMATRQVALERAREAEEDAAGRVADAERRIREAEEDAAGRVADAERRIHEAEEDAAGRVADAEHQAREAEQDAHDEVRILRAELVAANQSAARARVDFEATKEELEDTSSKLLGSWEILREMRQSRSWQITAPLRRAKSIFRRR